MRSEATKTLTVFKQPPPDPAMIRPSTIIQSYLARPQRRVPIEKKVTAKIRPARRPYMSVSLPERGWQAALARTGGELESNGGEYIALFTHGILKLSKKTMFRNRNSN